LAGDARFLSELFNFLGEKFGFLSEKFKFLTEELGFLSELFGSQGVNGKNKPYFAKSRVFP